MQELSNKYFKDTILGPGAGHLGQSRGRTKLNGGPVIQWLVSASSKLPDVMFLERVQARY
jgi:hypothetical protein